MSMTAPETLMLELLNRARLDPEAEAERYDLDDLNRGLPDGRISGEAQQVLSPDDLLLAAARAHSLWMLEENTFSHTGIEGSDPGDRMASAGYVFTGSYTWGENISWSGTTGTVDPEAAILRQHRSLFLSDGHRKNILNPAFQQVGVGHELGVFTSTGSDGVERDWNASMVTQNFAASGSMHFLTGVAFADLDGDLFYDVGEGRSRVHIAFDEVAVDTYSDESGLYEMAHVLTGQTTVHVTLGGDQQSTVDMDLGTDNVKLDVVLNEAGTGSMLLSSASMSLHDGAAIRNMTVLGIADLDLTGNALSNRLEGNRGDNRLSGGDGHDTLFGGDGDDVLIGGESVDDLRDVAFGGAGHDSIDGGHGNDELRGDDGNDTVSGGFGTDTVIGGAGDDVLTGEAWSDMLYGNDGADFVNGGFGHDRVNGGDGADRFFHLGIADHGSDWIQDFSAADGDVLVFGRAGAVAADFQVNITETANAGVAGVEEAFVIYRPTGQIMWALVDGAAQDVLTLMVSGVEYDLLA
ncbi:CAP domain-containing protein [Lutimaribacter marinistellae]|uniref:CAP domain-containing protein n=1 Tax=Lutimaribacter marinistellae TaxID=1820329 RepID=A0ABV7TDX2_9RHOB